MSSSKDSAWPISVLGDDLMGMVSESARRPLDLYNRGSRVQNSRLSCFTDMNRLRGGLWDGLVTKEAGQKPLSARLYGVLFHEMAISDNPGITYVLESGCGDWRHQSNLIAQSVHLLYPAVA